MKIWYAIKRLALGLVLIALASAALLISDRDRRTADAAPTRVRQVAIVQHASTPVLDEGVKGMIEGLAASGFSDGGRISLHTYNAQGDLATGNAIAARDYWSQAVKADPGGPIGLSAQRQLDALNSPKPAAATPAK